MIGLAKDRCTGLGFKVHSGTQSINGGGKNLWAIVLVVVFRALARPLNSSLLQHRLHFGSLSSPHMQARAISIPFHVFCITKQLFHMSLLVNYFNCFVISGSRCCSLWSGLDRGDEDVQCLPGGDTSQGLPSPSPRRPRRRTLTSSPHCYLLVAQESQKKEFRTGPKENREKYKSCWHFDHVIYYCSLVPTLGVSFCTHFFKYSYC